MSAMRNTAACVAALLTAAAPVAAPPAVAQNRVSVELGAAGAATRSLTLPKGKSAVVELPVDARDVMVSNPAVVDAVLSSPRRIFVLGKGNGQSDAVFFDQQGRKILSLDIRVDAPVGALQDSIRRLVPGSDVRVEALGDGLVLSGSVPDTGSADRVQRLAAQFVTEPEQLVSLLNVAGRDQVMLRVQVAEVKRSVIKQLGFNLETVFNQIGEPQWILGSVATYGLNGSILGGLNAGVNLDTTKQPVSSPVVVGPDGALVRSPAEEVNRNYPLSAVRENVAGDPNLNKNKQMIQAFERVGLVRTLAEPNLSAVSGESAKFLAGGEFPVPVGIDEKGNIAIEYKPFGVGLAFTPVVLGEGRISLKVSTEVSETTAENSFTLGTGPVRLVLPGLNVRRAETTVELPSGGAMMIAGLIKDDARQNLDKVPGVADLPVLGSLFRSRDFISGETELVVIITPYLTKPGRPGDFQTPADGLQIASDAQTLLFGKLNKAYGAPPPSAAARWTGPVGYVIE
jgi:pilus assembly protein CpaC